MPPEDGSLGEDEKWSSAAFRAWSAEVPPEEIVAALGLQPTKMFRKGDPYSKRSTSIRQNHLIVVEAAVPARESLERHLIALCDIIEPVAAKLPAIADRCGYDIFCGFSSGNQQGGFTLSPDFIETVGGAQNPVCVGPVSPGVGTAGGVNPPLERTAPAVERYLAPVGGDIPDPVTPNRGWRPCRRDTPLPGAVAGPPDLLFSSRRTSPRPIPDPPPDQPTSPQPPLTPRSARRKLAGPAAMLIGAVGQDN